MEGVKPPGRGLGRCVCLSSFNDPRHHIYNMTLPLCNHLHHGTVVCTASFTLVFAPDNGGVGHMFESDRLS